MLLHLRMLKCNLDFIITDLTVFIDFMRVNWGGE